MYAEPIGLVLRGSALLAEPHVQHIESPGAEAHGADPALLAGLHDSRVLEHAEVLHQRRQRHGDQAEQVGHGGRRRRQALHDRPTRRIGECAQDGVHFRAIVSHAPNYGARAAPRQPATRRAHVYEAISRIGV